MLKALIAAFLIIALSMALLSIKILLKKGGRFPNTHVGGNAALRREGITCVQTMDALERAGNPRRINERMKTTKSKSPNK